MRKSNYIIYSALPKKKKAILVHGYTGAVDIVDIEVLQYLLKSERESNKESSLDIETTEILKKRGYLTDKTPEEEKEYVYKFGALLHKHHLQSKKWRTDILIIPTYKCQLRCPYCYEAPLYKKGSKWRDKTIEKETVDAAFEAVKKIQDEKGKIGRLTIYGGEPLMKETVEIINYIVEQGYSKEYSFDCITNGVDLDYFIDLLGPKKIRFLQITLDGPPQIHDRVRRYADGKGTFHKIADNINKALETGVIISARTNVTPDNIDSLSELVEIYKNYGWLDKKNFRAYSRLTYKGFCSFRSTGISRLDMVEWFERKDQPLLKFIRSDFGMRQKILGLLEEDKYPLFTTNFCGSTMGMYILDPYGDIYVCWETVGTEKGKVGRFKPEFSINQKAVSKWHNRVVVNIPECLKCEYIFLCGGGCPQHAYHAHGGLMKPSCEEFKELFQRFLPKIYGEWKKAKSRKIIDQNK